jgi:hypothetical protein
MTATAAVSQLPLPNVDRDECPRELQKALIADFAETKPWMTVDDFFWYVDYIAQFATQHNLEEEGNQILIKLKKKYVPISTETLEKVVLGKAFDQSTLPEKVAFLNHHRNNIIFVSKLVQNPGEFIADRLGGLVRSFRNAM